jgi:hypothetical protein
MVFPTMTEALHYSYEARGYGLVFGFSALAFYCWQRAAETERAILYRIGLGFGLCGAWMSHYYGLLLFFPIMVGEIVRTRMLKKLDPSMWMIFAASLLPILMFLPLIQASASYGQNFWAKPHWLDVFQFYDYLLHPVAIWTIFILISLSILGARHNHEIKPPEDSYPAYELAAITAFMLVPFIAMIAAKLTTGALTNRHLLFIVAGVSIIFAYALSYSRAPRSSLILALVLFVAGFFGKAGSELHRCNEDFAVYERTVNFVQTYPERSLPVACWVSPPVMQVWYYGPRELATRMFYLANPEDSVRYVGHDTIDRGLIDLKPWFPINNVQPYRLFVRSHKQFLLYYGSWPEDWVWNWIMSSLVADRMHIELKARQGDQYLFLVTSP